MIEGHTDSSGNFFYNQQLSMYRAEIVKNYLIGQGLSPSRINVLGKGSENPLENNKTPEGREKNRRVEVRVYNN